MNQACNYNVDSEFIPCGRGADDALHTHPEKQHKSRPNGVRAGDAHHDAQPFRETAPEAGVVFLQVASDDDPLTRSQRGILAITKINSLPETLPMTPSRSDLS